MSIKRLYNDIFERVEFLDKNVTNPFFEHKGDENPFAQFFGGTYVWVEDVKNSDQRG